MLKLRIGRFSYSNLFPIFYMLDREADCSLYEFIEGVPSELNRKIRQGEIDVSPSSSIEYLRNQDLYDLIPNHSISSRGPVGSIFLFSKRPIEALDGLTVLTTSQSETSVALLRIILTKFYDISCRLMPTAEPISTALRSHEAYLLIGDDALTEALKWPKLHIYDLGDLWYKNTGLPSVFALWIVRRLCCSDRPGLVERFRTDLDLAKDRALRDLSSVAAASPLRHILTLEELVAYWKGISFDFGDEHRQGLDLFGGYARQLGLI
ncbi:MAG: menaquinone biosynthesis protein [Nitrospiraceae bacterium]|nr:menaquinone biosynthesis protein [Nitrospiraceae bacterium]